jgi:hypothetical protein
MPRIAVLFAVAAVVALATAASGCATVNRPVSAGQLTGYASDFVAHGSADVAGLDGTTTRVRADEVITVRITDHDGVERPVTLTVRALVEGCTTDVTSPACLASRAVNDTVLTRRKVKADENRIITMIAVAGVGAGLGWCTVACEDPDAEFKRGAMIGGGVAIGFAAMMALFLFGGH